MSKFIILSVAAMSLTALASANDSERGEFSIRAFVGVTTGDVKNKFDIDHISGLGFEYAFATPGKRGMGYHIGAEYSTSSEAHHLKVDVFGMYVGGALPLDKGDRSKLSLVANVGYYSTIVYFLGSEAADRAGFGWDAGLRYSLKPITIELLFRSRGAMGGSKFDNNSISLGFLIPVK